MKLLTITIPCYNSAEYMDRAIESVLSAGEDIEIIIVNDGSTDNTGQIADEYADKYPSIVRVIHQENGGHGEGVNAGIRNASGLYFKVVDSDDWLNEKALSSMLDVLRSLVSDGKILDLMVTNYVYENMNMKKRKVIHYRHALPRDCIFTWNEIMHFRQSQNILMHSITYRTKLLRDCNCELPKHTFYVDNIFVYQPLPHVKSLYYLDVNLYRYFIGRSDQSVNEQIFMKRIDQQVNVTKLMICEHDLNSVRIPKLRKYMLKYLTMMMAVSSVYLIKVGDSESLKTKDELWNYLKKQNHSAYRKIRSCILGHSVNLPGSLGRKLVKIGYRVSLKIFGFSS